MVGILILIGSLLPVILTLLVVGFIIYVGNKRGNYSTKTKIFSMGYYILFSIAFLTAYIISFEGNDTTSLIAFSVVGGLILLPIVVVLIMAPFQKTKENYSSGIMAKLVDCSPASLHDDSEEAKNKYNAVFMHVGEETLYYTSYEMFDKDDIASRLNQYVEIQPDNERCTIMGHLIKTVVSKEKKETALRGIQFAVYLIERVPLIIGLIIIDIVVYSKLNFIWWCLLVLITLAVTYNFIKKLIMFIQFNKYMKEE